MSAFTPGPWYADMFGNVTTHPPRTGLKMLLPTKGIIAKTYKNEEANARLISAAPELLEAALLLSQGVAELVRDLGLGTREKPLGQPFLAIVASHGRLDAAIAKAGYTERGPDGLPES